MKLTVTVRIFLVVVLFTVMLGILNRRGGGVNTGDGKGYTLLHAAARDGDAGVARILLSQGADANARNEAGETPLDVAERTGHTEVADILRNAGGEYGR